MTQREESSGGQASSWQGRVHADTQMAKQAPGGSIHSSIHPWIYSYHFQKGDDIDFCRLAVRLMFISECVGAAHSTTPAAAHWKKKNKQTS